MSIEKKDTPEIDVQREVSMRYVLHPGWVRSPNDGDRQFIGGPRLCRLYGLDIRSENVVFGDVPTYEPMPGDIHLRPSSSGNYTLPTE